jgi:hypothetical protein
MVCRLPFILIWFCIRLIWVSCNLVLFFGLKPAFIYLFWSYGAIMITLWLPVAPFDLCLIRTYFYQYIGIIFYCKRLDINQATNSFVCFIGQFISSCVRTCLIAIIYHLAGSCFMYYPRYPFIYSCILLFLTPYNGWSKKLEVGFEIMFSPWT